MNIVFKSVSLVNFGSYKDSTLNLQEKGICLISGENRCQQDNAKSNGSGKSTLFSAICWALTGETPAGVKSNLKNINIPSDTCSVSINFLVDSDEYVITRFHKPKSDMKIVKNGTDISGKGIKESEKVLQQVLPDLTKELITSTIILAQGLPNKFSALTPAERKALLEKLTKSDFMIEDVKTRIANRQKVLQNQFQDASNTLLVAQTNVEGLKKTLGTQKVKLEALENTQIDVNREEFLAIPGLEDEMAQVDSDLQTVDDDISTQNTEIKTVLNNKAAEVTRLTEEFHKHTSQINVDKATTEANITNIKKTITQKKSIRDVCPTCGQKLVGVEKPSTEDDEKALSEEQEKLNMLTKTLNEANTKFSTYKKSIDDTFSGQVTDAEDKLATLKTKQSDLLAQKRTITNKLILLMSREEKFNFFIENHQKQIDEAKQSIADTEKEIQENQTIVNEQTLIKADLQSRIDILKKIETFSQRDFRGYLLTDIIKYLDQKSKEYCEIVFNNRDISVSLNGNALDIVFANKNFDSLSGGEKQRVDLILQFAIRNLLQNCFGFSSNILVLDEIFDNLDRVSTDSIIKLIAQMSDIESIFIVSHHSAELDIPVDSEVFIVKQDPGVSEIL